MASTGLDLLKEDSSQASEAWAWQKSRAALPEGGALEIAAAEG